MLYKEVALPGKDVGSVLLGLLITANPGKREKSQGKCLGANFKLLMLKVLSVFLFFIPLKGTKKSEQKQSVRH